MEMGKISLLRELEYNLLSNQDLNGEILDLGGSKKSGYHDIIKGNHNFTVVNISEEYGYDLKFDIQEKFPLADEFYDNIIAINVLEHIYKYQNVANESYRVLKKGGKLVFITPFMFNVHGSPDDYFRYTKSALLNIFLEAGFEKENINIEEIGTGVFHIFYQMTYGMIPGYYTALFLKKIFIGIDHLLKKISNKYADLSKNYCLGYFIEITK